MKLATFSHDDTVKAGVGLGFEPPRFLVAGDTVAITISKLGELSNPVA